MEPAPDGDEVMQVIEQRLSLAKLLMRFLKSVAPFSVGTLAYKLVGYLMKNHRHFLHHPKSKLLTAINYGMLAEALFAVACAIEKVRGQKRQQVTFDISKEQRNDLFRMCLQTVDKPREFATRWLRDYDMDKIRRGNAEDWLSWGMFGKDFVQLTSEEGEEIEGYIDEFERVSEHKMKPGHNGEIRCYKFDHEPVESQHRPLMYYFVVHGVFQRVMAPLLLRSMSFSGMKRGKTFNYWVHKSKFQPKRAPLVLIHGIGIGVLPYIPFIKKILAAIPEEDPRDLIVLELPAVAQQLFPKRLLPDEFVQDVKEMLTREGIEKACFVGHSYGTFCLSWLIKKTPEIVDNLAFLDPAPFLLHHSTTLRAIVYKDAYTDAEKLFQYFLRSELFFNNHIRRHFNWIENILFLEQIPKRCEALIVLSEHDDIMPVNEIRDLYEASPHVHHLHLVHLENNVHGGLLFSDQGDRVVQHLVRL